MFWSRKPPPLLPSEAVAPCFARLDPTSPSWGPLALLAELPEVARMGFIDTLGPSGLTLLETAASLPPGPIGGSHPNTLSALELVALLRDLGASPFPRPPSTGAALSGALLAGRLDVAEVLLSGDVRSAVPLGQGDELWDAALRSGQPEALHLLKTHGIPVETGRFRGFPLWCGAPSPAMNAALRAALPDLPLTVLSRNGHTAGQMFASWLSGGMGELALQNLCWWLSVGGPPDHQGERRTPLLLCALNGLAAHKGPRQGIPEPWWRGVAHLRSLGASLLEVREAGMGKTGVARLMEVAKNERAEDRHALIAALMSSQEWLTPERQKKNKLPLQSLHEHFPKLAGRLTSRWLAGERAIDLSEALPACPDDPGSSRKPRL